MQDNKIHDVIIVGAGPSAMSAAIYLAREDLDVVVYDKGAVGGMAATTDHIDNYPGFVDGIDGMSLAENMQKQAEKFGAKFEYGNVTDIRCEGDIKILSIDDKEEQARAVLIATGSANNKLHIPGEAEYYGKGVHYCATCDGFFYRGKKLAVVGGANSAIQEAMFLTKFASHIDLIVRSTIKASEVLQHELQKFVDEGKITIHLGTVPERINGDDKHVTSITIDKDYEESDIEVDGVFVFTGFRPNAVFLQKSKVELDEIGYVKTNLNYETNVPGIFASGDVRLGATKQVICAAGEGASAAMNIREYLK